MKPIDTMLDDFTDQPVAAGHISVWKVGDLIHVEARVGFDLADAMMKRIAAGLTTVTIDAGPLVTLCGAWEFEEAGWIIEPAVLRGVPVERGMKH